MPPQPTGAAAAAAAGAATSWLTELFVAAVTFLPLLLTPSDAPRGTDVAPPAQPLRQATYDAAGAPDGKRLVSARDEALATDRC